VVVGLGGWEGGREGGRDVNEVYRL
jgi:hypothetical protein